ncbi:MAG: sigma-70 family RNA polymerase sigma factor [Gemmatimonadota bacterium]|nr:MAG: sigma-70 family RNA polymerase sigma factor [Gemmatimonadota bacterium]
MFPESFVSGLRIIAIRALGDEDDAADAVQETLARAVDAVHKGSVPSEAPLPAFVYGIARHVIADTLRRRCREYASPEMDRVVAPDPSPLEQLVQTDEVERVRRALRGLARSDRELLRRCYENGERIVDIAGELGEPPERLRKRKSRALGRLRDRLEEGEPGHVFAGKPTLRDDGR